MGEGQERGCRMSPRSKAREGGSSQKRPPQLVPCLDRGAHGGRAVRGRGAHRARQSDHERRHSSPRHVPARIPPRAGQVLSLSLLLSHFINSPQHEQTRMCKNSSQRSWTLQLLRINTSSNTNILYTLSFTGASDSVSSGSRWSGSVLNQF